MGYNRQTMYNETKISSFGRDANSRFDGIILF